MDPTVPSARKSDSSGSTLGSPHHRSTVPDSKALPTDVSDDRLLKDAPRTQHGERQVPSLGGIPLLSKLGQGGMGAVYYGIHPRLQQEVAVKVLPFPMMAHNPQLIDRFFREAQIAAKVKSPHLVGVLDVNEEGGLFYLVMEFVNGLSAHGYLKEVKAQGRIGLPELEALDTVIAASGGLCAAHDEDIVHRDIKPDNILIPRAKQDAALLFAQAKLADLGLARSEEHGQSLTGTGSAMGTAGYMSPEQAMDAKAVKKPGDVFSMGATLYALLAGTSPFHCDTATKSILKTIQGEYTPLSKLRSDVSVKTVALIDRCLAKDTQRPQDARALLEALVVCRAEACGQSAPQAAAVSALPAALRPSRAPTAPASAASPSSHTARATSVTGPPSRAPLQAPSFAPGATPNKAALWIGGGVLGALALIVILMLSGMFSNGPFVAERDLLMKGAEKAAATGYGEELSTVSKRIDAFLTKHASQSDADLEPVRLLAQRLEARGRDLAQREQAFGALLEESKRLAGTDPNAARAKLMEAAEVGRADAATGYPDLVTTMQPSLTQRLAALPKHGRKLAARPPPVAKPLPPQPAQPAEPVAAAPDYQETLRKARASLNSGNYDGAEKLFQEVLQLNPDERAAHDGIALVQKRRAEFEAERQAQRDEQAKAAQATQLLEQAVEAKVNENWEEVVRLLAPMEGEPPANEGLAARATELLAQARTQLKKREVAQTPPAAEPPRAAPPVVATQTEDPRYTGAMEAGNRSLADKVYHDAAYHFQNALRVKPGDADATAGLKKAQSGMDTTGETSTGMPPPPPGGGPRPGGPGGPGGGRRPPPR